MLISKLKNAFKLLFEQPLFFLEVCLNHIEPILSDSLFLQLKFYLRVGYWPNISNPQSFNEKLQWLKLHDKHQEYTDLVDKATVKGIVASRIGEDYVIPTIAIFNSLDDINWDNLPNQFVLKSTGDSGGVIICKDKKTLDIQDAIKTLKELGQRDYGKYNKEYPYANVPHRYIVENYMEDESGYELKDYKIFCFNGTPRFIQLDFDRQTNHHRNIYDTNWNLLDIQIKYPKGHDRVFPKPVNLEKMLQIASELSKDIPHVRVDLYNVNGKIYFGELTFFHGTGMEIFTPRKWDFEFGKYLVLPTAKKGK